MIIEKSVKKIKDHGSYWAIGFDEEKVKNGEEDLTRLNNIDDTKSWDKDIVACKRINPVEGYDFERLANDFNMKIIN